MNIGSHRTSAYLKAAKIMKKHTLLSLVLALSLTGCSIRKLVVAQTADVFKGAMPAFEKDWDYDLVELALPGNIKMIEAFLEADPGNQDLLFLSAQAYTAYALVFLEDHLERSEEDTPEYNRYHRRAKEGHLRGHRYGLRLIDTRQHKFSAAFNKGGEALDAALAKCTKDDAPALFWTAMPLAAATSLDREDISLIASWMEQGKDLKG